MIDYTISDTVTLPSRGKVYNKEVPETLRLKSMTTQHEMMRLSHSEFIYKNLCDIIDDCLVDPIGISAYDLCLGDYQAVLYKLRAVTYGPEYKLTSVCPYCGAALNDSINLDELVELAIPEDFESLKEVTLPKSQNRIKLRLQSPRTLDVTAQAIQQYKKKNPQAINPSIIFTLAASIDEVDGVEKTFYEMEQWLRSLPAYDMNFLASKIDNLNSLIGIDTKLLNHCDECGEDFYTSLRITNEFFRPSFQ